MNKLNKLVQCKLNENDYNNYIQKVTESGYTQSEFFRNCVLNNRTEIVDKTISKNLIKQLAWIGNNLNQISHVLNSQRKNNALKNINLNDLMSEIQYIKNELNSLKDLTLYSIGKLNVNKS